MERESLETGLLVLERLENVGRDRVLSLDPSEHNMVTLRTTTGGAFLQLRRQSV